MKYLTTLVFVLSIVIPSTAILGSLSGCSSHSQRKEIRQDTRIESRTKKRIEKRSGD